MVGGAHEKETDDDVVPKTVKSVGGSGKFGRSVLYCGKKVAVVLAMANTGEYQPAPLELIAAT